MEFRRIHYCRECGVLFINDLPVQRAERASPPPDLFASASATLVSGLCPSHRGGT